MPSSCASSAWMTTSTPSPRTLRSGSVTSAATSISASEPRLSPVISQSTQTRRSAAIGTEYDGRLPGNARAGYYGVCMPPPAQTRRPLTVAGTVVVAALAFYLLSHWQNLFDLRIYIAAEKWWLAGGELYDFAQPDKLQGNLFFTY